MIYAKTFVLTLFFRGNFGFAPRIAKLALNGKALTSNMLSNSMLASSTASSTMPDGMSKAIIEQGSKSNGMPIQVGDVATVKYTCSTLLEDNQKTFSQSNREKMVVGEGLMVDGWEIALLSMKKGERAVFTIDEKTGAELYGYGTAGVPPVIAPNAALQFDITVLDVEQGADLGTIASADPLKPRDPKSIAEAYSTRRELAALEAASDKQGIEGLIEKFKSYYFFGFFEGETGQQAPWYLRPSITFPLAFAIVGATFWVSFQTGAIYERGSQATDELDDIILTNFVTIMTLLIKM